MLGKEFFGGVLRYHCVRRASVAAAEATRQLPTASEGRTRQQLAAAVMSGGATAVAGRCHVTLNTCEGHQQLVGYACMALLNPYHDRQSFDTFGAAVLVVFQCLTGEGFTTVMYEVWRAHGRAYCVPYFLSLGLVGTNLIFNMILAVIKDSISSQITRGLQQRNRRNLLVMHRNMMRRRSSNAQSDVELAVSASSTARARVTRALGCCCRPLARCCDGAWTGPLRHSCARLARSTGWGRWNMLVIMLNTLALCCPYAAMPTATHRQLNKVFLFLNLLFTFDLLIKLGAFGLRRHFTRHGLWDLFDAFVIVTTLVESLTQAFADEDSSLGSKLVAFRLLPWLRVLRVLELGRMLDSLRAAMAALFSSIDLVLQTFFLVSIAIGILAAIGGNLFICDSATFEVMEEKLSCYDRGYFSSMLSVFQVLTLEGWHELMFDGLLLSDWAATFYMLWVVFGAFVLLSVVDSSVLDNFERDYFSQRMRLKHTRGKRRRAVTQQHHGLMVPVDEIVLVLRAFGVPEVDPSSLQSFLMRRRRHLHRELRRETSSFHEKLVLQHGSNPGLFSQSQQPLLDPDRPASSRFLKQASRRDVAVNQDMPVQDDMTGDGDDTLVPPEVSLRMLVSALTLDAEHHTAMSKYRPLLTRARCVDFKTACEVWSMLDDNNSGFVDIKELAEVFGTLGDRQRMVDPAKVFATMDLDSDGHVSIYEFMQTLAKTEDDVELLFSTEVLRLREQFDLLDVDGSGTISFIEFRTVMERFEGHSISQVEMDILMQTIDMDASGKITFLEILRGMQRTQKNFDLTQSSVSAPRLAPLGGSPPSLDGLRHIRDSNAHLHRVKRHWAFSRVLVQQIVRSRRNLTGTDPMLCAAAPDHTHEEVTAKSKQKGKQMDCWKRWTRCHCDLGDFENLILFLIFVNVAIVASASPKDGEMSFGLSLADALLSAIFVFELMLRLHRQGLHVYFCGRRPPGSGEADSNQEESLSTWNCFDFALVSLSAVGSWSNLLTHGKGGADGDPLIDSSFAVVGRMLRALRPMRTITRDPRMRRVTGSLIAAWPAILNIFMILLFSTLVFTILGMQLFGAGFYHCESGGFWQIGQTSEPSVCAQLGALAGTRYANVSLSCSNCTVPFLTKATCHDAARAVGLRPGDCKWAAPVAVVSAPACVDGTCSRARCLQPVSNHCSPDRRWVNRQLNFDNMGNALSTLFVVFTFEGWLDIARSAMEMGERTPCVGGVGNCSVLLPPTHTHHPDRVSAAGAFFVTYISLAGFFLKSLFIGATFSCYLKQCDDEFGVLTRTQRMYALTERLLDHEIEFVREYSGMEREQAQSSGCRRFCWWVVDSSVFRYLSMVVVLAQVCVQMASHVDEPAWLHSLHTLLAAASTTGIALEVLAFCILHGMRKSLKDLWFMLDVVTLVATLLATAYTLVPRDASDGHEGNPQSSHAFALICIRLIRTMRYFRFFHVDARYHFLSALVRNINKLQVINEAFVLSLGYVFQIGVLLLLCYVIFAILAMNAFGSLSIEECTHLTSQANFQSFGHSLLTIIRVSYGEDWQLLYQDLVWAACDPSVRLEDVSQCPHTWSFLLFFVALFFVGVLCVQNLFIALIVDDFAIVVAREYNELAMEHVAHWLTAWKRVARIQPPSATAAHESTGVMESFLTLDEFVDFLKHVPEPLGVGRDASDAQALERLMAIGLHAEPGGRLYFTDTLRRGVRRVATMVNPTTRMDVPHLQPAYLGSAYIKALLPSPLQPPPPPPPSEALPVPLPAVAAAAANSCGGAAEPEDDSGAAGPSSAVARIPGKLQP